MYCIECTHFPRSQGTRRKKKSQKRFLYIIFVHFFISLPLSLSYFHLRSNWSELVCVCVSNDERCTRVIPRKLECMTKSKRTHKHKHKHTQTTYIFSYNSLVMDFWRKQLKVVILMRRFIWITCIKCFSLTPPTFAFAYLQRRC